MNEPRNEDKPVAAEPLASTDLPVGGAVSEAVGDVSSGADARTPGLTEQAVVSLGALPPAAGMPPVPEPPYSLIRPGRPEAGGEAAQASADLPAPAELVFAEISAETGNDAPPSAANAEVTQEQEEEPGPGLFERPQVAELHCLHDIRTPDGRTMVRLGLGGWGSVHAEAELDGQMFSKRLWYGWPRRRELDLLVPIGAKLIVTVRNLWGTNRSTLEVLASEPALPSLVLPAAPEVIGVQMPPLKLPPFPSSVFARLIPPLPKLAVSTRRRIPAIDDSLSHAILLESRRLNGLSAWFGAGQRYQRERFVPTYAPLRVADVNIAPVRDRLHAWMVEIHHGEDMTEGG